MADFINGLIEVIQVIPVRYFCSGDFPDKEALSQSVRECLPIGATVEFSCDLLLAALY
jgi:hypothetical protein